jgi:(1->4)-alpha-D-glucan 1-alpha-D-glucosylmutase
MSDLREAAARIGLATDYIDAFHNRQDVAEETIRAILDVIGIASPADAAASCLLFYENEPLKIPVPAKAISWQITTETGDIREGTLTVGQTVLELPTPGSGYYTLNLFGQTPREIFLIITPRRCYKPWPESEHRRVWGISTQLYSLRSPRNWGIGDFTDLAELIKGAAQMGAALVGVNPLHILFPDEPENASPYSPSSRQYLNWLYLDIEAVPEFGTSGAAKKLAGSPAFIKRLNATRTAGFVDYTAVTALKREALIELYREFRAHHLGQKTERDQAFEVFRTRENGALRRFATFQVLRETFGAKDPAQRYWRNWPTDFQTPEAPSVVSFTEENREAIEFHEYLQFLVSEQLAAVRATARAAAMPIGLYGDLAVGIDNAGSDAWCEQGTIAVGLTVGAPPDIFNVQGQNWGISLFNPITLRQRGYKPFVNVLRSAMKNLGALRIDHVLGLMRLYCIPTANPKGGAYLTFPFDDLARIVALESHRNRCLVVGEDLGTLPPGAQEKLAAYGLFSYRLLWFEHEKAKFVATKDYPEQALVAISTHDLPTLAGFWNGTDIDRRESLGLLKGKQIDQARKEREDQREGLRALLTETGLSREEGLVPFTTLHELLASTPSQLMLVQLEDVLGLTDQVNMPATTTEHPNWRRKLPLTIEEILASEQLASIAQIMARAGRNAL